MAEEAAAAVALLAAAAVGAPSFKDAIATLQAHAAEHPALVSTLAAQLRAALAALPGRAGAAAASAPAAAVDLAAATCTLPGVACLAPRGRFDVVLLPDAFALVTKGAAAVVVPFAHVQHILLLEKPPEANAGAKAAAQRTVYFMLPLASDKEAAFGKQKLPVLLLSAKSSDAMPGVTHPSTKAPLEGGAARVVATALSAAMGLAVEESGASGFCSARGAAAVAAHVKVNPGLLFPLRSGLAFVERPPLFLPAAAWDGVSLGRAAGTSQTFDLVVGTTEFGMIAREEMPALQEYVASRRKVAAKKAAKAAAAAEAGEAGGAAPAAAAAGDDSDGSSDEDFAADGSGDSGGSGSSSSEASGSDDDAAEDAPDDDKDAKRPPPSDSDDDSDGGAWGMHAAEPPAKQARAE